MRNKINKIGMNFFLPALGGFVGTTAIAGALPLALIGGIFLATIVYLDRLITGKVDSVSSDATS